MAPRTYERIWREWLIREDYSADIQRHLDTRQPLYQVLAQLIKDRQGTEYAVHCLEIGCGSAIDSYIVADRMGATCYAVDLTEEAVQTGIAIAKYFHRIIHLVTGDASCMSFRDGAFDIVFSQGVLEHFDDELLGRVMSEQVRVLHPGGYLVIDVPQKYNWYTIKKHILMWRDQWPWGYETEFSVRGLQRLGKKAGLNWLWAVGYRTGYRYQWLRDLPRRLSESHLATRVKAVRWIGKCLDAGWDYLEHRYGQHFLVCVIAVFQKNCSPDNMAIDK